MTQSKEIIEFKKKFLEIKSMGFVSSRRYHDTGIGKTFEDLMGVDENNLPIPDFGGIEIKTQRAFSSSYITLFTKSPDFPKGANAYLRDTYGYPHPKFPSVSILHTSFFHTYFNTLKELYGFKLEVDKSKGKIFLRVKILKTNIIEDVDIYYNFSTIENIIAKKLKKVVFITAQTKSTPDGEKFNFTKAILLTGFTFDKFIELIKTDNIMYDIRIGAYKSGKNIGKSHDYGSGFRIKKENLNLGFTVTVIQ